MNFLEPKQLVDSSFRQTENSFAIILITDQSFLSNFKENVKRIHCFSNVNISWFSVLYDRELNVWVWTVILETKGLIENIIGRFFNNEISH